MVDYNLSPEQSSLLEKCLNGEIGLHEGKEFTSISPMAPRVAISYGKLDKEDKVELMTKVGSHSLELADTHKKELEETTYFVYFKEPLSLLIEQVNPNKVTPLYEPETIYQTAERSLSEIKLVLRSAFDTRYVPEGDNGLGAEYREAILKKLSNEEVYGISLSEVTERLNGAYFGKELSEDESRAIVAALEYKLNVINTIRDPEFQGLKDILVLNAVMNLVNLKSYTDNRTPTYSEPFWVAAIGIDLQGMGFLNNTAGPGEVNDLLTVIGSEIILGTRLQDISYRTFSKAGDEFGTVMQIKKMSKRQLKKILKERSEELAGRIVAAQLDLIREKLQSGIYVERDSNEQN